MKQLFILLLLAGTPALHCQNLLDDQGQKTGFWKVEDASGNTLYEARFQHGNPVGEMVRYYENGTVRARMMFDSLEDKSFTKLYYKNGKQAAEGWYVNRSKDSVWTYFSEFDGSVRIRESYQNGNLHGIVRSYYSTGVVSEEVHWQNNIKNGAWKQFYEDGSIRLVCGYRGGMLDGSYELFYPDSTLKVRGFYLKNQKHDAWSFFDESGKESYSIEYLLGRAVHQEKFQQMMADSLEKYQLISEPETMQHY